MTQGTLDSGINKTTYQRQTLMNLYNSDIERDIISLQLDVSNEEVDKIIEEEENRRKKALRIKNASNVSVTLGSSFYLDAVVDISLAISNAQTRCGMH
jgi:adenylate cyclase